MTSRIHDLKVYAVEPGLNLNIGDNLPPNLRNIIVRIRTDVIAIDWERMERATVLELKD